MLVDGAATPGDCDLGKHIEALLLEEREDLGTMPLLCYINMKNTRKHPAVIYEVIGASLVRKLTSFRQFNSPASNADCLLHLHK